MFGFIAKCGFANTDMEWSSSIEWRHISGVRTHRSVKWCLKPINHRSWDCTQRCSYSSHCLLSRRLKNLKYKNKRIKIQTTFVYCYTALLAILCDSFLLSANYFHFQLLYCNNKKIGGSLQCIRPRMNLIFLCDTLHTGCDTMW